MTKEQPLKFKNKREFDTWVKAVQQQLSDARSVAITQGNRINELSILVRNLQVERDQLSKKAKLFEEIIRHIVKPDRDL